MRVAVIDLGTNTFHLLIYLVEKGKPKKALLKAREIVKLAEDGIATIGEEPFARALNVLSEFKEVIDFYSAEKIFAFGTAALRTASNSNEFLQKIKENTGIEIEVISGEEEAEFIFAGVKRAVILREKPVLVMDIGGGSVEFIIGNKDTIFYRTSIPIGAAVLREGFHHEEPISEAEVSGIRNFLTDAISEVIEKAEEYEVQKMIGTSGSFESVADIIAHKKRKPLDFSTLKRTEIKLADFKKVYQLLLESTLQERLEIPGLVPLRADMIVVAVVLIDFVVQETAIKSIIYSDYALKEGVLYSLLD